MSPESLQRFRDKDMRKTTGYGVTRELLFTRDDVGEATARGAARPIIELERA
jgi:hypothetical protein